MSMNSTIWKQFNPAIFFKDLQIPANWETLEDFVNWYMESKIPMMIPWNAEVVRSDDAVAICLFRQGAYQVELYLIYPQMYIRAHTHPRMEVITMELGGGGLSPRQPNNTSRIWGDTYSKLMPGEFHGGETGTLLGNGFCILSFEKWNDPNEMTSAAAHWKGELQGPIQAQLIKDKNQISYVTDDYADITQPETGNCI